MGKLKNAEKTTLLLNNCSLYSNSRRLKKEVGEGGRSWEKLWKAKTFNIRMKQSQTQDAYMYICTVPIASRHKIHFKAGTFHTKPDTKPWTQIHLFASLPRHNKLTGNGSIQLLRTNEHADENSDKMNVQSCADESKSSHVGKPWKKTCQSI